ncbi:hypothetical protein H7992_14460 [Sporosarcina sp. resist]|uniref:hypothetical protein n=1 Tax=Sporosarcina sp. resist TaxID=2762563 RepID=UPI00164D4A36|nr:hypothetical protein [Sporosarcina sp. resist]QNK86462.1 hypothetical protein H7992_14460 [Sporosarcina sp. resist]
MSEIKNEEGDGGLEIHEAIIIIDELVTVHHVTRGPKGELLSEMDYRSLVSLLAIREAVNS